MFLPPWCRGSYSQELVSFLGKVPTKATACRPQLARQAHRLTTCDRYPAARLSSSSAGHGVQTRIAPNRCRPGLRGPDVANLRNGSSTLLSRCRVAAPRVRSSLSPFFSLSIQGTLDAARVHCELELLPKLLGDGSAVSGLVIGAKAFDEGDNFVGQFVGTTWSRPLADQTGQASLLKRFLSVIEQGPREPERCRCLGDRHPIDLGSAEHFVLDLYQVARVEELVGAEELILDIVRAAMQFALRRRVSALASSRGFWCLGIARPPRAGAQGHPSVMRVMPTPDMNVDGICRNLYEYFWIIVDLSLIVPHDDLEWRQNCVYTSGVIHFTVSPSLPAVAERSTSIS